jgi:hypothetical protein
MACRDNGKFAVRGGLPGKRALFSPWPFSLSPASTGWDFTGTEIGTLARGLACLQSVSSAKPELPNFVVVPA